MVTPLKLHQLSFDCLQLQNKEEVKYNHTVKHPSMELLKGHRGNLIFRCFL